VPKLDLPQGTITYREAGSGEAVVFLHGYLMDSRLWDGLVERLAPELRCIALDLPFGAHRHALAADADLSARGVAQLVADALAALGLEGVTLVGNDSGGAIAQVVAAEHPERLARLVLTPCDCFDNFPPSFFITLVWAAHVPGALTAAIAPLRLRAPRALPIAYGWVTKRRPLPHALIDNWVRAYFADRGVRRDLVKVTRGLDRRVTEQAARALARFDRPVLLAFAPDDRLFPMEHAHRLAAILPDARVVAIEDSRTWVMIDQPERTAEVILEFVRATAGRGKAVARA
jgi:pimeloyl-ACP methyl ester carboxylesterase